MPDLLLYPAPRRCAQAGPGCTLIAGFGIVGAPAELVTSVPGLEGRDAASGPVRLAIDAGAVSEAGDEAYRLVVAADGVRITARSATGLRWGLATLVQLRRSCGETLPGLVIDDAPAFRERGYMLDISRDRVPTMASFRQLVDAMASLKLNHLQLYTEHTFAYVGHEVVWRAADPVTPAEMRELDAYAAVRGVVLTANQNSFGHFERWLRHPTYAPLGETDRITHFAPWGDCWMNPNTLCPGDPGSIALVDGLFGQLFPCCSGPYANVGGDEPCDLGLGRSREACASQGRGRVFSDYLGKVLRSAQKHGKRPQFWCDPHPNEDNSLPRDITALIWGYGQDEDFATRLAAHAAAGREVWVAPGSNNWSSYAGRSAVRHGNLTRAAQHGRAHGAVGLLNTEWGDNGHRQQWPLALLGLADGAQAAWAGDGAFDAGAAGAQVLGSAALGRWLDRLGRSEEGVKRGHGSPTFNDGNCPWGSDADRETLAQWQAVAATQAALEAALPNEGPFAGECLLAVRMARLAADRAVARRGSDPAARMVIKSRGCDIFADYRRSWLARSRYGGLEDSYAKLSAMMG
jgi:hexosaminidase